MIIRLRHPQATSLVAYFEIDVEQKTAIVSAALGIIDLMYRKHMMMDQAFTMRDEMVDKGWTSVSHATFDHEFIYDIYR